MKKKWLALVLIFAMLIACNIIGGSKTPTPTPTWLVGDLGWGSITGAVIDSDTGKPVAGATVTCSQFSYNPRTLCDGKTTTASDGSFAFRDVFFHDTDAIDLEVSAEGYTTQQYGLGPFTQPWARAEIHLVPVRPTPVICCTAPACGPNETYYCPGTCPCGCGTTCATITPAAVCTKPACGPYDALCCPGGNCVGGCGMTCVTPAAICTPPRCAIGTSEAYTCPSGCCPGGCGTTCATFTPTP